MAFVGTKMHSMLFLFGMLLMPVFLFGCKAKLEATSIRSGSESDQNHFKESLSSDIEELTIELISYREQITALDGNPEKESLEKQAAELELRIASLKEKVDAIDGEIPELHVGILQDLLSVLQSQVDILGSAVEKDKIVIDQKTQIAEKDTQIANQKTQIAEKDTQIQNKTISYSGVIAAILTGAPNLLTKNTSINVTVSGEGASEYSFDLMDGTNCTGATFIAWSAVSAALEISNTGSDGNKTLCVKGRYSLSDVQTDISSVTWMLDTDPPTASHSGEPAEGSLDDALNVIVSGIDVVTYRYDLISSVSDCSGAIYSAVTLIATPITEVVGADGIKILCIKGIDPAGNEQVSPTSYSWAKGIPAGFTQISKATSGLAYNYLMMTYEASLASGTFGADSISTTESDLSTCSYEFHKNQNSFNASCGTKASTAVPQSTQGSAPIVNVSWDQAFAACRNMSNTDYIMRLASREEWQRAAKWTGNDYAAMWTVYTGVSGGTDCKVNTSADTTGNATACLSSSGVYDVAGNISEWVDERMLRYDIESAAEDRFSYGPIIGRTLENGIDQISRRFHLIDPGVGGLALAMGANFETPVLADRKQYGADIQTWKDPTTSSTGIGFRCVAFARTQVPTMAQLTLPSEPKFTTADLPFDPKNWKVPENLYEKDTKIEEVSIIINGTTTDSVAEGEVKITWTPWSKDVCNDAACSAPVTYDNFTYKIYRYREPTKKSIRLSHTWALTGAPYAADEVLDPLLATSSDNLITTVANCVTATPANCTFTDSIAAATGFSTRRIYRYLIVATDSEGNSLPAMVQRYRSPYFVGDSAIAGAATFRTEPRYRKASVFLVDEEHQQAKAAALRQIMVHVPMDKSGLDHDFYIQKYEGALASGAVTPGATTSKQPEGATDGGTSWIKEAAECYSTFLLGGGALSACDTNATTATIKSEQGVVPLTSLDHGAAWRACMNTSLSDVDGNAYYLNLPTNSEWTKAADWGDVDLDGKIDQHVIPNHVDLLIPALEGGSVDTVTVRCHTDNNPGSKYNTNSANTANCRSRYGMADHVGNVWEWVADREFSGEGLDNGIDGLWMTHLLKQTGGHNTTPTGFDLLRGTVPADNTAGADLDYTAPSGKNGDNYYYNSTLRATFRGGGWDNGANAGRWFLSVLNAPSDMNAFLSVRCGGAF